MKDWKKIASAYDLQISEDELGRIAPALDSLEKSFRPLVQSIPQDLEPALTFGIPQEETE